MKIRQISFELWDFKEKIDLMICDIPFSINFTGKPSNYNRKSNLVVDGYVEWKREEIDSLLARLFFSAELYLKPTGSLLIFAGWQMSNFLAQKYLQLQDNLLLIHQGKLYWNYNFSPYCQKRPNTNCYEIFWFTKSKEWFYNNECSLDHCQKGESNLSAIFVKKEYLKGIPKYPTRFPSNLVKIIIEHFSNINSVILDPLCGSGIVGVVCKLFYPDRIVYLGDLNSESQTVFNELFKFYRSG
jgi:site-specific DNA-methyltransferase (adenine-specific)